MSAKDETILTALLKSTYLGLMLNTLIPAGILIFSYMRYDQPLNSAGGFDLRLDESISPLFFTFLALSLIEMVIIYLIRTKLPTWIYNSLGANSNDSLSRNFVSTVYKTSLYMFLFTASISCYGLVMMFMGSSFEVVVLFVALTFASYQIFRPRKEYLEKLYDQLISE